MKKFNRILWNNQQGNWRNWQNKARKKQGTLLSWTIIVHAMVFNVTCNTHAHLMKGIYFLSLCEMSSLIHAYICN